MVVFSHKMIDDGSERLITVHADEEGFVVMTVFTSEEWQMVLDVVGLTGGSLENVVKDISDYVTTIMFDPKDFPGD